MALLSKHYKLTHWYLCIQYSQSSHIAQCYRHMHISLVMELGNRGSNKDFFTYRMRAIITRGLYFFTPFFTAVYIVERLLLQTAYVLNNGNSSFFESKIRGL